MRDASDENLMLEYARGSMAAFELLYDRYRQPLYAYFSTRCGNQALAGDLYQGCWEKVIKARGRYAAEAPFRAWLFRIAHNHLVDSFRSNRPLDELDSEVADTTSPAAGEQLDDAAQAQRLRTALAGLPDEQRDAMVLKLDAGLDLATIAEVTGVGIETAKSRLRYATRSLKQALQT
jgi:RNA polymerase sigma-70 factor (ECF subfamily)